MNNRQYACPSSNPIGDEGALDSLNNCIVRPLFIFSMKEYEKASTEIQSPFEGKVKEKNLLDNRLSKQRSIVQVDIGFYYEFGRPNRSKKMFYSFENNR